MRYMGCGWKFFFTLPGPKIIISLHSLKWKLSNEVLLKYVIYVLLLKSMNFEGTEYVVCYIPILKWL